MGKWACLTSFLLAGCAVPGTMLPGSIYDTQGAVLPFQIEVTTGAGRVAASDPATGETFAGTYAAVLGRHSSASTTFGTDGQSRFTTSSGGSNLAPTTAFLKGDKGSMLTCEMQIAAGFNPHGIGTCQDNRGKAYRLQF